MSWVRAVPLVVLCLLAGACGGDDRPRETGPSARPSTVAELDPTEMRVVRIAFCDLVPKKAVRAALAAAPTRARSWGSGDALKEAAGEVGHELGCAWFGPHGRSARAWVFARPVDAAFARTLVRSADRDRGCRARAQRDFGAPGLVQTCERAGTPRRIRYAGLFGTTWLTCEVGGHGAAAAVRKRADRWCAAAAGALDAGRG